VFTRERVQGTGDYHVVNVTLDTFGLFARGGTIIPVCLVSE